MHDEARLKIDDIRATNEREFGARARRAIQRLLEPGMSHAWLYVYELTQNARDAGATRVLWRRDGDAVIFAHDGKEPLNHRHVEAISSLGNSTKGLNGIGFMGVGFKSVFARFATARVAGWGWHFRFDIPVQQGALASIPQWIYTMLPTWDEQPFPIENGYTTAFRLEGLRHPETPISDDLARLVPADPTPFAVLALRGLREVTIDGDVWSLAVNENLVTVTATLAGAVFRWRVFRAEYTPSDAAMKRYLEVRQELGDDRDEEGNRALREAVLLLPLDQDGTPRPPAHGEVYATLPTQVNVPFGFHLQADWLLGLDRQDLRDVKGHAWHEEILGQVPQLVRMLLEWLSEQPAAVRAAGYAALRDPSHGLGPLAEPLAGMRARFASELAGSKVVPILHANGAAAFCMPPDARRLPSAFVESFGKRAHWRADLVFGDRLVDERVLGFAGGQFARWLGWGKELSERDMSWPEGLADWFASVPPDERIDALLALWDGISLLGWGAPAVVPTESGAWVTPGQTKWLNEEPPSPKEKSGAAVLAALAGELPTDDERVLPPVRRRLAQGSPARAWFWLQHRHKEVKLADVIARVAGREGGFPHVSLVELFEWAMGRGDRRQDLVPRVLTELGPKRPTDALLADPLVEGGLSRRALFRSKAAVVEDYAALPDRQAVLLFLDRLNVAGNGNLIAIEERAYHARDVARLLHSDERLIERANASGWRIYDLHLPFDCTGAPADALYDWLLREHAILRGKGGRWAESFYQKDRETRPPGSARCAWVHALQSRAWVPCEDGQTRRPSDVLLEPNPDLEDAPLARIDSGLAGRLVAEGVSFGHTIPKAPAVRRLMKHSQISTSDDELAAIVMEALAEVRSGTTTSEALEAALPSILVRGKHAISRIVRRAGPSARSDLDGWVIAMTELSPALATALEELRYPFPATTTGSQAIAFLEHVWETRPLGGVEELRRHIAAAYRYVLDDTSRDDGLRERWLGTKERAHLYGRRQWHALQPSLAVDDISSPLIRRMLPTTRVAVAAAHLGDDADQVARVASALGISRLSQEIEAVPGRTLEPPSWGKALTRLLDALGKRDEQRGITSWQLLDKLTVRVAGKDHDVRAFIEDRRLLLCGEPARFAAEATSQLVENFQLSQRGSDIPWLTTALVSLKDGGAFANELSILCGALGIELDEQSAPETTETSASSVVAPTTTPDDTPGAMGVPGSATRFEPPAGRTLDTGIDAHETPGHIEPREQVGLGERGSDTTVTRNAGAHRTDTGETTRYGSPHEGSEARASAQSNAKRSSPEKDAAAPGGIDHFGILISRARHDEHADVDRGDNAAADVDKQRRAPRRDERARRAVLEYERRHSRAATETAVNQEGYDVRSVDGDVTRLIEVKGTEGAFDGDASVVLTWPQARDVIRSTDPKTEYWLYVVERTATSSPRVHPIPWQRRLKETRYGFYARAWATVAETPEDVELADSL